MVIWITGLAGAGKTTIAEKVYKKLKKESSNTVLLDGDVFRNVFGENGYSRHERFKLAQKISNLCSFLSNQGINVVCATIGLFKEIHQLNRTQIKDYIEVYIDVSMEELIRRDKKGLYSGAISGEIKNVVGVDIEYDIPKKPELIIKNNKFEGLDIKIELILNCAKAKLNNNSVSIAFEDEEGLCLQKFVEEYNAKKILLITGRQGLSLCKKGAEILQQIRCNDVMHYKVNGKYPTVESLYELYKSTKEKEFDMIVAIGGGSVIDIAKSIKAIKNIKISSEDELRKIINNKRYCLDKDVPIICVPTTIGTGSEVTKWATIWDEKLKQKYSIEMDGLYAAYAVMTPIFLSSLSLKQVMSGSLDALSHALEAYWSSNSNEISKSLSIEAIKNIVSTINEIKNDSIHINHRKKLFMGSLYSGLAFSFTKTTACHAISYPLTLNYGIEHGIAASITLYEVLKINEKTIENMQALCSSFNVKKMEDIEKVLGRIYEIGNFKNKLKYLGVNKEELEFLARLSLQNGRIDNNPVKLDEEKILKILKNIY